MCSQTEVESSETEWKALQIGDYESRIFSEYLLSTRLYSTNTLLYQSLLAYSHNEGHHQDYMYVYAEFIRRQKYANAWRGISKETNFHSLRSQDGNSQLVLFNFSIFLTKVVRSAFFLWVRCFPWQSTAIKARCGVLRLRHNSMEIKLLSHQRCTHLVTLNVLLLGATQFWEVTHHDGHDQYLYTNKPG